LLVPRSVDSTTGPELTQFGKFGATGALGAGYAPLVRGSGGNLQQDMQITLPVDRLSDRRTLLAELDRIRFSLDASGQADSLDKLREQAFTSVLQGAARAFDLTREEPHVVERYDTAPLVRPDQINRKWNNHPHYVDHAKSLGKLLFLARGLCWAGCGFVTVSRNFVWDMHADVNNATCAEGMRYTGPPLDHALAT